MNIPKIEEAITLLYQTYIEDKDVAKQRGIAITAMNEMVKLLGGDDVVAKIEAIPYSARLIAQYLFEDAPQRTWVGLTDAEIDGMVEVTDLSGAYYYDDLFALARAVEAALRSKNT